MVKRPLAESGGEDGSPKRAAKAAKKGPAATASSSSSSAVENKSDNSKSDVPKFELPMSSIMKLIKRGAGNNVSLGKSAKTAFIKAAGIFVLYLTYCSSDYCKQHKRSTISARDIFDALKELEFEDYVDDLQESLAQFRRTQQDKKQEKRKRESSHIENEDENVQEASSSSAAADSTPVENVDDSTTAK